MAIAVNQKKGGKTFNYEALTPRGDTEHGVVEAESSGEAKRKLKTRGYKRIKVWEEKAK